MPPDPDVSSVTDEDLEAFFANTPNYRTIPPLNGGDPNLPIQFHSGDGRVVPPSTDDDLDPDAIIPTTTTGTDAPPEPVLPDEPTLEPEADAGEGADDVTTTAPPPAPEPVAFVEFEGQQISATQLSALLQLQQDIINDPALGALISGHLVGRVAPVEGGAPATAPATAAPATVAGVTPPEGLDLEDPSIAGLWAIVQQQNDQIRQLSAGVQTTYDAHMAQERASAESTFKRAAHDFKTQHELSDDDISKLTQIAARLNVVPSLLQGVDPLTGVPVRPDPLSAVSRALEIAYFMDPDYRSREFQRSVKVQQTDAQRKKKLGAVGGSSGSVTRQTAPPRPGTPEAKQAMLAEVGQMMTGEWTGSEN